MNIRKANIKDSEVLTEISFSSKRYWNYPEHYFEIWKSELTISPEYIRNNEVFVLEDTDVKGYYSVSNIKNEIELAHFTMSPGTWLDHVFIKPNCIGKEYGKFLMGHLVEQSQIHKWSQIHILADPNSLKFYQKLGASYIKEVPSNIENRTVSYLIWKQAFSEKQIHQPTP